MISHSNIDYREIHSPDVLRALFQFKVCSLDFEFLNGCEPVAYGVASGSYARGFRIGKYPGNDRTKYLRAIPHKEFAMRLQHLVNTQNYKVFIIFGAGDYHGLCRMYDKSQYKNLFPHMLICNIQPVLAKQLKEKNTTYASMIDAAYLMDVSLLGYQQHNPRDDARLLFEMAKKVIAMTPGQYRAYQEALSKLAKHKNINSVKAAFKTRISGDAETAIYTLQNQLTQLSAIRNEIRHMRSLLAAMKQEHEHGILPCRKKITTTNNAPSAQEIYNACDAAPKNRTLFIDEVLFHYPQNDRNQPPGAITIRHNNKSRNYFLFVSKAAKKDRKKLGLTEPSLTLDDLKGRYKTQVNQEKTIVLIVQKAQYNEITKTHFETLLRELIPTQLYVICEV